MTCSSRSLSSAEQAGSTAARLRLVFRGVAPALFLACARGGAGERGGEHLARLEQALGCVRGTENELLQAVEEGGGLWVGQG